MYYTTRQDQDNAVKEHIKEFRDAAALYPMIKRVLTEFDKKVLNKRLETALQDRTGARIYVKQQMDYITLEIYGHRGNVVTLLHQNKSDLIDGKRIDAAKMIDALTERRAGMLKKAADYEKQMEQIDTLRNQIEQIKRQLDSVKKSYDYTVLDIYRLNYNIRNY